MSLQRCTIPLFTPLAGSYELEARKGCTINNEIKKGMLSELLTIQ